MSINNCRPNHLIKIYGRQPLQYLLYTEASDNTTPVEKKLLVSLSIYL